METRSPQKIIPLEGRDTRFIINRLLANQLEKRLPAGITMDDLAKGKDSTYEKAGTSIAMVATAKIQLDAIPNRLQETVNEIKKSLGKLPKASKDLIPGFEGRLALLTQATVQLQQKQKELVTEFLKLNELDGVLQSLITEIQGKKSDPQIIMDLLTRSKAFSKAVTDFINENEKKQEELDVLHKEIYALTTDKSDLAVPTKLAERIPPAQRTPTKSA